jgi:hypothetical protein
MARRSKRDRHPETLPRRAGLREDELEPGQPSGADQQGDEATGSPDGSTGIAGLPEGDGKPGNAEISDVEPENEPQSGRSGGAVGGTPANKRATGR